MIFNSETLANDLKGLPSNAVLSMSPNFVVKAKNILVSKIDSSSFAGWNRPSKQGHVGIIF